MVEIEFPAGETIQAATRWFEHWLRIRDEAELSIRADSALGRVPSTVLLAACASERRERNLATSIEIQGKRTSWEAMESGTAEGRALRFVRTETLPNARRAAETAADELAVRSPNLSPSIVRMARFVFEELGANVVQHSGAPKTGVGWAESDSDGKRFSLAFADCGVGIRASLQRNPELAGSVDDDAEALQLALSPRVSGTPAARSNMGWGLKALVDFSDLMDAQLRIASGHALLVRKSNAGERTNVIREIPTWQGCWIAVGAD